MITLANNAVLNRRDIKFKVWILAWSLLLGVGITAGICCFAKGLHITNMDNRFVFALWIFLDLTVIAFGAGAFFTGFLLYILKRNEVREIINMSVVVGFICYSSAIAVLVVDVGQPLRAWFTFRHPNLTSMLAEVTICITCYLLVLILEYFPLILQNKKLASNQTLSNLGRKIHKSAFVLAALGTLFSFFHQGSLGGLYGVLNGRPFAFREGFAIWPATFFLFILSAVAVGPSFLLIITEAASRLSGRKLISNNTFNFLGRLSGRILALYVCLKAADTLLWANNTVQKTNFHPRDFFLEASYGTWILFVEIVLLGALPAVLLLSARVRKNRSWLISAATMGCAGIALNRYVQTIQTLAVPTTPFDGFDVYIPNLIEILVSLGIPAYGVLLFSLSFRYLPLYPSKF